MDLIISFVESLKPDIILFVVIFIFNIICFFFSKRITKPAFIATLAIFYSSVTLLASQKIFMLVLVGVAGVVDVFIINEIDELDFRNNIFSLSIFGNIFKKKEQNSKIIGRIFPWNKYQLKFNMLPISFNDTAASGGTLITGSTGSGKTMLMESLIHQDLVNGHSVAFFDYKGDLDIIRSLKSKAEAIGVEVFEMSAETVNFNYDPLASLNNTGRIEALLNTRKWSLDGSDAHYRTSTHLLIQKLVTEFEAIWEEKVKDGSAISYTFDFYNFVTKYNYQSSAYDAYNTVNKMLELMITSEVKDIWFKKNSKDFSFDLDEQFLVIFSFVSSNKELANSISSLAFKELLDVGTRNNFNPGLALYVDEFGTLENSFIIKDILEKGRSSCIQTTVALQDINQIVINTNQAYLNSILGTVNTFIIFSGATKITAEMLSGVQNSEIDKILISLRKPFKGKKPTAFYISKYPTIEKNKSSDAFRIYPYIYSQKESNVKNLNSYQQNNPIPAQQVEQIMPEENEILEDTKEDIDFSKFI